MATFTIMAGDAPIYVAARTGNGDSALGIVSAGVPQEFTVNDGDTVVVAKATKAQEHANSATMTDGRSNEERAAAQGYSSGPADNRAANEGEGEGK